MLSSFFKVLSLFFVCILLASCGGGGGGGSDSGTGDKFGLRVIHGALRSTPIEYLNPNDEKEILSSAYLGKSLYKKVPEGGYNLHLYTQNSGASDVLSIIPVTFKKDLRQSVFLYNRPNDYSLFARFTEDSSETPEEGMSMLRVFNGISSERSILVNIEGISEVLSVSLGSISRYISVPAAITNFSVEDSSSAYLNSNVDLTPGKVFTLVLSGKPGVYVTFKLYQDN